MKIFNGIVYFKPVQLAVNADSSKEAAQKIKKALAKENIVKLIDRKRFFVDKI